MRSIFLVLLAAGMMISCKDAKKTDTKTESKDSTAATTPATTTDAATTMDAATTAKRWSDEEKKKAHDECVADAVKDGTTEEIAGKTCSCMVDKAQTIFTTYKDMEATGADNKEIQQAMVDCEAEAKK